MSDDNMILRGDAIEAITKCNYRTDVNIAAAINDIPARHPAVKLLDFGEINFGNMFEYGNTENTAALYTYIRSAAREQPWYTNQSLSAKKS
jgi:hypothetical protein